MMEWEMDLSFVCSKKGVALISYIEEAELEGKDLNILVHPCSNLTSGHEV